MNAIKKETSDAMKQVDAATQKGSKSMQNLNGPAKKVIDSIRNMNAEIRKMSNDASVEAGINKYSDSYLNLQQAIKDTERQIDILNKKQASMPDTKRFKPSEDYLAAQNQYESALKRIDELSQQKQMYDDIGIPNNDGVYQKLVEQLEEVRNEAKYVKGELDEMVSDGSSQVETDAWKGLSNQIQEARSKLQMYNEEKMQMECSGANVSPVVKGLSSGSMIESAGVTAKTAASVAVCFKTDQSPSSRNNSEHSGYRPRIDRKCLSGQKRIITSFVCAERHRRRHRKSRWCSCFNDSKVCFRYSCLKQIYGGCKTNWSAGRYSEQGIKHAWHDGPLYGGKFLNHRCI